MTCSMSVVSFVVLPISASRVELTVASERFQMRASTALTEQPERFERDFGIRVRMVALGTAQALDRARGRDAHTVLVHDPAAAQRFVSEHLVFPNADADWRRPAGASLNVAGLNRCTEVAAAAMGALYFFRNSAGLTRSSHGTRCHG